MNVDKEIKRITGKDLTNENGWEIVADLVTKYKELEGENKRLKREITNMHRGMEKLNRMIEKNS